jgi:hypothetical protein
MPDFSNNPLAKLMGNPVSLETVLAHIESIEPAQLEEIIEKNPDIQIQLVKLLSV